MGSIAQLGEHLPYKQGVTSSSLVVPTIKNCAESRKNSADIVRTLFLLLKACFLFVCAARSGELRDAAAEPCYSVAMLLASLVAPTIKRP